MLSYNKHQHCYLAQSAFPLHCTDEETEAWKTELSHAASQSWSGWARLQRQSHVSPKCAFFAQRVPIYYLLSVCLAGIPGGLRTVELTGIRQLPGLGLWESPERLKDDSLYTWEGVTAFVI